MRILALLLLLTLPLAAQNDGSSPSSGGTKKSSTASSKSQPKPAESTPAPKKEEKQPAPVMKTPEADTRPEAPAEKPKSATNGVRCDWFGHAFIYLTSGSGVRVGIDPFGEDSVAYDFPKRLDADVVLMSCESPDRSGGARLNGSPQLFRSITAIGINQANGILFSGIESTRDLQAGRTRNAIFTFEMDHIRFCHLGGLGTSLDSRQKSAIGRVDVLFLPVGNPGMRPSDWSRIIEDLKVKWVVPIAGQTRRNSDYTSRTIEEFLALGLPSHREKGSTFIFNRDELPKTATALILAEPVPE